MMRTDFLPNVDQAAYFAGKLADAPALSQSCATTLLTRSPKHAHAQHPRFGNRRPKATDAMDIGNVLDQLVLGGVGNKFTVLDFDEFRTKEARAARDAVIEAGKIPLKRARFDEYVSATEAARSSMAESGIDLRGAALQACLLWGEKASNGNEVQCCALLDMLWVEDAMVRDLKTGADCSPAAVPAKCIRFGYDVQAAAYISAVEHVFPALAGRVRFENVWLETSYPFATLVSEPDGEMLQLGRAKWRRAIDTWEQCVRLDKFPGYQEPGDVLRVAPPAWAIDREDEPTSLVVDESDGW